MSQIPFLVETARVLEILSKQIYDSPYAMVRENIQNAYDAVLMRARRQSRDACELAIDVEVTPDRITIRDEGIGMSEEVLRQNFWRAGSSGKNNDEARAAGVIGTFGIGAMANFGVCDRLQVDTRPVGTLEGFRTSVQKSQLSIGENCIELEVGVQGIQEGTTVYADVSASTRVDVTSLRNYIVPFIQFLRIPVRVNGETVSGQSPASVAGIGDNWVEVGRRLVEVGQIGFEARVLASGGQFGVVAEGLTVNGARVDGGLWLRHQGGQIMGLRSRFGLAPVPVGGVYQFGGFVDLPFLVPTAGREALTRESIEQTSQIVSAVEMAATELLHDTELADSLAAFQQHVLQIGRTDLANRVSVQLSPGDERAELGRLSRDYAGQDLMWYAGSDPETIRTFSNDERPLVRVSQQNPRRELQHRYLRDILQSSGSTGHRVGAGSIHGRGIIVGRGQTVFGDRSRPQG